MKCKVNSEALYSKAFNGYIDAVRDEILERYGSMDDYLRAGLGLTKEEIERLREGIPGWTRDSAKPNGPDFIEGDLP